MPQIPRPDNIVKKSEPSSREITQKEEITSPAIPQKNILNKLETDDILLIVVGLLLLANGCDDILLLAAIGFIFISGIL